MQTTPMQEQRLTLLQEMITILVLVRTLVLVASSTTTQMVLHLLIPVQHKTHRKCNRCRRIKPTPTADYANNTKCRNSHGSTLLGDNHTGSNDSQDFSIGKASSTTVVTVTGAPFTYTGSAQTQLP
jgi:hypothetical protein